MAYSTILAVLTYSSLITSIHSTSCKVTPDDQRWPSGSEWESLNSSISGRLLRPSPPGAPCHPNQPVYNNFTCQAIQTGWKDTFFHSNDPISTASNNWNNDSCLPFPTYPCSGAGYPIYVVNASEPTHVQQAIKFAKKKSLRLIVKGTGHDYLGRSVAPNALSIWTHHIKGIQYHTSFKPKYCDHEFNEGSVTIAAGVQMAEIYETASKNGVMVVGGMSPSVGIGGYITGGGHSALSSTYGLAADQVLEIEVVTPSGDLITANECKNSDLFWALRGGGGSTFGVITSVTVKTFPSKPIASYTLTLIAAPHSEPYWDAITYFMSETPRLSDSGVAAYLIFLANDTISVMIGIFVMIDNTTQAAESLFTPILSQINSTWSRDITLRTSTESFPDYYPWWLKYQDNSPYGLDLLVGSRLLDGSAMSSPVPQLKQALKQVISTAALLSNMVAGKGVWNSKPRGGSNAVNPAWRKAYHHFTSSVSWPPLDTITKDRVTTQLRTQSIEPLRKLNPDSGCYVNEADPEEPNFQQAFWGTNYQRLLKIKKRVDPDDVFWCHVCVGNEGWKEVDGKLCRV